MLVKYQRQNWIHDTKRCLFHKFTIETSRYRLIPAKDPSFYKFAIPLTFVIFNIFSFSFIPLHHGKYCLALCWIVGSSNKKKLFSGRRLLLPLQPPLAPPSPAATAPPCSCRRSRRRPLLPTASAAAWSSLLLLPPSPASSSTLLPPAPPRPCSTRC